MMEIKKLVVLCLVCFLLSFGMNGQVIGLNGIKVENTFASKFVFEVSSFSDSTIVYSVSLEVLGGDMIWHEIRSDVFNYTPAKKTRIFAIGAKRIARHFFYPNKLLKTVYQNKRYRLKVKYGYNYDKLNMAINSQSFLFKR